MITRRNWRLLEEVVVAVFILLFLILQLKLLRLGHLGQLPIEFAHFLRESDLIFLEHGHLDLFQGLLILDDVGAQAT